MGYYLLLACVPLAACCQSVSQKQYNLSAKAPNAILFSAITSLIALLFFLFTSGFDLDFHWRLIPYALGFAVCYSSAWVGTILALRYGPMAISTLIVSCSLIFPTFYGILLGEKAGVVVWAGIVLLFSAMVLVNLKLGQKERFSLKWFLCVMAAFAGNGICSVIQNMQKRDLGEGYTHEFMLVALAASFVILMAYALTTSKNVKNELRFCLPFAAANGVANAVNNLLMLTIIGNIPNTILYPTSSALNMLFTFVLAFVLYKERFSKLQYLGYALGVLSIVLLNI